MATGLLVLLAGALTLTGTLTGGGAGLAINAAAVALWLIVLRRTRRAHLATRGDLPRCLRWIP